MTNEKALVKYDKEEIDLIKQTVAKDATDAELKLFLLTAQSRGLNPLTRQIHFVKRRQEGEEVGVIQTGIDGFRLIAQRTGQYAPSPKPTLFEYDGEKLIRATVYGLKIIGAQAFEFCASASFKEYAQKKRDGSLFPMWVKMPETMIEKCAEAKMLRRGFPEELSGLYTHEEMQQADNPPIEIKPAEIAIQAPEKDELVKVAEQAGAIKESDPLVSILKLCPIHSKNWLITKYGKRSHKEGEGWCNFSEIIKPLIKEAATKVGLTDGAALNEWLKEKKGKTWSKLSESEQVDVIITLKTKEGK